MKCKALGLTGAKSEPAPKAKANVKAKEKGNGKAVMPQEVPDIGAKVKVEGPDGKKVPVEVVGAKLQVKFADGKTKWLPVGEIIVPRTPKFQCAYCGLMFMTENGRDNHWWDKHVVTCNVCG